MINTIMKLFNLEYKIINDIEAISVDNEIFLIISLKRGFLKARVDFCLRSDILFQQ